MFNLISKKRHERELHLQARKYEALIRTAEDKSTFWKQLALTYSQQRTEKAQ